MLRSYRVWGNLSIEYPQVMPVLVLDRDRLKYAWSHTRAQACPLRSLYGPCDLTARQIASLGFRV